MSLQYQKEKLDENIEGIKASVGEFKDTYFDEDTEWNEGLGKKAWYPLKKIGDVTDHVMGNLSLRDQLQIAKDRDLLPGQTWDDAILDYSAKDLRDDTAGGIGNVAGFVAKQIPGVTDKRAEQINDAFELGGQIILPDITDVATGGLGYLDNLGRAAKQLRKFDAKAASKMVDEVFNAKRFTGELTNLKNSAVQKVEEVTDAIKAPFDTLKTAVTGMGIGTAGDVSGGSSIRRGFSHVPPNPTEIYKVNQKLLNSSLLGPKQKFNYAAYKGLLNSDRGRTISILFQTTPHTKIPNWATHRKYLVDVFEGTYGDVMKKLNISRSDIDIDHLFTLQQSMPIYDNVAFGSDLWNDLQRTILNRKYQPGNSLANLNALDPGTHQVKTAFFNALHGKNGSKFFTKKRMKLIQNDPVKRMELLNKYLDETDKAKEILINGQTVWKTLYGKDTIMPDELVEALANIPINKFSHPTLKGIIKEIVEDEAARYARRVQEGEEALRKAIETGQTPRVTKKNILPTQKQIDKAIKDAGTSYQPTLDPGNPDLL